MIGITMANITKYTRILKIKNTPILFCGICHAYWRSWRAKKSIDKALTFYSEKSKNCFLFMHWDMDGLRKVWQLGKCCLIV